MDRVEEPSGLRRQLIQGLAEHRVREPVGDLDVGQRRLHVGHRCPDSDVVLTGALVLVQQRDGRDQVRYFT